MVRGRLYDCDVWLGSSVKLEGQKKGAMEWNKHVERRKESQDERKCAPNSRSGKENTNTDDGDHGRTEESVTLFQDG